METDQGLNDAGLKRKKKKEEANGGTEVANFLNPPTFLNQIGNFSFFIFPDF